MLYAKPHHIVSTESNLNFTQSSLYRPRDNFWEKWSSRSEQINPEVSITYLFHNYEKYYNPIIQVAHTPSRTAFNIKSFRKGYKLVSQRPNLFRLPTVISFMRGVSRKWNPNMEPPRYTTS